MNATGKRARKRSGMNRTELHFFGHAKKSEDTRRRKGWQKAGKLTRAIS